MRYVPRLIYKWLSCAVGVRVSSSAALIWHLNATTCVGPADLWGAHSTTIYMDVRISMCVGICTRFIVAETARDSHHAPQNAVTCLPPPTSMMPKVSPSRRASGLYGSWLCGRVVASTVSLQLAYSITAEPGKL